MSSLGRFEVGPWIAVPSSSELNIHAREDGEHGTSDVLPLLIPKNCRMLHNHRRLTSQYYTKQFPSLPTHPPLSLKSTSLFFPRLSNRGGGNRIVNCSTSHRAAHLTGQHIRSPHAIVTTRARWAGICAWANYIAGFSWIFLDFFFLLKKFEFRKGRGVGSECNDLFGEQV